MARKVDKKETLKKLASLSALGAGAIFLTGQKAQAGSITFFNGPTGKVGFSSGFGTSFNSKSLLSNIHFGFDRASRGLSLSTSNVRTHSAKSVRFGGSAKFKTTNGHLAIFNAGAAWNTLAAGSLFTGLLASRTFMRKVVTHFNSFSTSSTSSASSNLKRLFHVAFKPNFSTTTTRRYSTSRAGRNGLQSFSNEYALFTFTANSTSYYGWVQLSLSLGNTSGPDLTITDYAFDNTGQFIAAGDTGTPEPATFTLMALALGAVGVRRLRASRTRP
jgi:hypothetical protein